MFHCAELNDAVRPNYGDNARQALAFRIPGHDGEEGEEVEEGQERLCRACREWQTAEGQAAEKQEAQKMAELHIFAPYQERQQRPRPPQQRR